MSYSDVISARGSEDFEEVAIGGAPWLMLFLSPPLAYSQACSMMLWFDGKQDFGRCIAWLWIDGFLYAAGAVMYTQTHKGALRRACCKILQPAKKSSVDVDLDVVSTGGGVSTVFQGDDDVEHERTRVLQGNSSDVTGAAIVIRKLVKSFDSVSHGRRVSKRAVNELCLAVQTNEIFGLLG